ncbi:ComF family protein [Paenibacillus elgii]|uniref:ComF family protein n=1 Tax=Paenibacillus elgii TaxID=189691 RepID=UPI0013D43801|nr:ComF family protein [Paenibacillus elgii]
MSWTEQAGRWMRLLMSGAESLLASKMEPCVACGAANDGTRKLSVCRRCWEAIPWIHEVCCVKCGRYEACPDCPRRTDTYYDQNRSAVRYDERMKEWLGQYKYRGQESLRSVLGPMLLHAYHLHQQGPSGGADFGKPASEFISYVPLSEQRYAERGFNQAGQLASELGRLTGLPVLPLLLRTRHTDKQSFKGRVERLDDLQGVFALEPGAASQVAAACRQGRVRVYLIDDVYTTGSTLNECSRAIKMTLPLEVCGISWAR